MLGRVGDEEGSGRDGTNGWPGGVAPSDAEVEVYLGLACGDQVGKRVLTTQVAINDAQAEEDPQ